MGCILLVIAIVARPEWGKILWPCTLGYLIKSIQVANPTISTSHPLQASTGNVHLWTSANARCGEADLKSDILDFDLIDNFGDI
ncbi:uncharacterized protein EI90DRAFT_3037224, partial [Cantharellus anzutake]|uniref:uncharacterized protein n=1 Tax=Cantharellus anzutake TaxID=1750568 RepID=UPI001907A090